MTITKTLIAVGIAASALSGCAAVDAGRKLSAFDTASMQVNALSPTTTMPTRSTATYTGTSAIAGSFEDSNVVMLGDTTMTANFNTSKVSGTIDNMVGMDLSDKQRARYESGDLGALAVFRSAQKVDGEIAINNGVIAGNTFAARTNGTVYMDGYIYQVKGGIDGEFRGANAQGIAASDGATFDFKRNGTSGTDVTAEIYVTK